VTREGAGGRDGSTTLALEDVEVLSAASAPAAESGSGAGAAPLPRVSVELRVSVRQAVYLAAAQAFARELRVLPRAPGDRRRGAQGLRVGGRL
jgi:pilus assembly protein CpaB